LAKLPAASIVAKIRAGFSGQTRRRADGVSVVS
jgi:hypothetical protein